MRQRVQLTTTALALVLRAAAIAPLQRTPTLLLTAGSSTIAAATSLPRALVPYTRLTAHIFVHLPVRTTVLLERTSLHSVLPSHFQRC